MAEIDKLLTNMARKQIQHVVLVNGQPMRVYKDGQEAQGPTFDLSKLMSFAREIVPPSDRSHLAIKYDRTFPYSTSDGFFSFRVSRKAQTLQIEAWLKSLAPASILSPKGGWNPTLCAPYKGHLNVVQDVALSSNGTWLASAAGESIDLWESATGRHSSTLYSRSNVGATLMQGLSYFGAWAVEFSPDDAAILGGVTFGVWTWSMGGSKNLQPFNSQAVRALAYLPDGTGYAIGTGGTTGLTNKGEATMDAVSVASSVASLAFGTPDMDSPGAPIGVLQVSNMIEGKFQVWTWNERPQGASADGTIRAIAISPNGQYLISGDNWHTVRIYDLTKVPSVGKVMTSMNMNTGLKQRAQYSLRLADEVKSVSCAAMGYQAVASCRDELVSFDVSSGSVLWRKRGDFGKAVLCPHGDIILAASQSEILVLSAETGEQTQGTLKLPATVTALTISRDGQTLACGCGDGSLHTWRLW